MKSLGKIFAFIFTALLVIALFRRSAGEESIFIIFSCFAVGVAFLFTASFVERNKSRKVKKATELLSSPKVMKSKFEPNMMSNDCTSCGATITGNESLCMYCDPVKFTEEQQTSITQSESNFIGNDCTKCGAKLSGNLSMCNFCDYALIPQNEQEEVVA